MSLPPEKKAYFFANWKMYLDVEESRVLANVLKEKYPEFNTQLSVVVFPASLAFCSAQNVLQDSSVAVGAQNVYWIEKGGYTGEVSADMYKKAGADFALVGHSERRHLFHETNHDVRQKMETALAVGLIPVLCVGETAKEREEGQTEEVVEIQLRAAFEDLVWPIDRECIIAYEPVWAVGTGVACDPAEAERMHGRIKELVIGLLPDVEPVILYGGSVRPENVRGYLEQKNIDGVLVGQASSKADSLLKLIEQFVS